MSSFHTEQQACNPTEVGPGDVCRRANVLHACKIQDDRHETDENKVGAADDAQKECRLSEFGTAEDHLKEHLRTNSERRVVSAQTLPPRGAEGCCKRVHLPSTCHVSGTGPLLSVYHIRYCRQQGGGGQSPRQNIALCPVTSLIRTSQPGGQLPKPHISQAAVSRVSHFILCFSASATWLHKEAGTSPGFIM